MMFSSTRLTGSAVAIAVLAGPPAVATVAFDWATIGNAGNAPDPATGLGSVDHEYRIATNEVTNAQYSEFLNSVAASDPNGLYNTNMANQFGGITRSGSNGSFSYSVAAGREDNPAVYVTFLSAMRFTNWLENGQGSAGTESGVYDVSDGLSEVRSPGANFFLPSEDEWYKAAYYQPENLGGDVDDFWLYPTSSNSVPNAGVDANFAGAVGNTATVGSYDPNYHGLFDMGGNASEWTEGMPSALTRSFRGGTWAIGENAMRATSGSGTSPTGGGNGSGFRIASQIPGPGPIALFALGGAIFGARRRN